MKKKKEERPPKMKNRWLRRIPLEGWHRGDWDNPDEKDAWYATHESQVIRVAKERNKKDHSCHVDGRRVRGNFKAIWLYLHHNLAHQTHQDREVK